MHIFKCACHVGKCKHLTKLIVAGAILFAETFTIYYFDEMTIPVTREKMCRHVCQCGPISKIDKINNKWLLLRTLARFDAYIDWILWCWSYFFVSHACIEVLFVGVLLYWRKLRKWHTLKSTWIKLMFVTCSPVLPCECEHPQQMLIASVNLCIWKFTASSSNSSSSRNSSTATM